MKPYERVEKSLAWEAFDLNWPLQTTVSGHQLALDQMALYAACSFGKLCPLEKHR